MTRGIASQTTVSHLGRRAVRQVGGEKAQPRLSARRQKSPPSHQTSRTARARSSAATCRSVQPNGQSVRPCKDDDGFAVRGSSPPSPLTRARAVPVRHHVRPGVQLARANEKRKSKRAGATGGFSLPARRHHQRPVGIFLRRNGTTRKDPPILLHLAVATGVAVSGRWPSGLRAEHAGPEPSVLIMTVGTTRGRGARVAVLGGDEWGAGLSRTKGPPLGVDAPGTCTTMYVLWYHV